MNYFQHQKSQQFLVKSLPKFGEPAPSNAIP